MLQNTIKNLCVLEFVRFDFSCVSCPQVYNLMKSASAFSKQTPRNIQNIQNVKKSSRNNVGWRVFVNETILYVDNWHNTSQSGQILTRIDFLLTVTV